MPVPAPVSAPTTIQNATLENATTDGDLVLPLSAIVTREGRRTDLDLLNRGQDLRDVMDVVDALSRSRLEPAQFGEYVGGGAAGVTMHNQAACAVA